MSKILIVYYSAHGHVFEMAKAVAKGAEGVQGTEVRIVKVPEFDAVKEAMSKDDVYIQSQKKQADIPEVTHEDLKWADGILWGVPTRYGIMPSQMKSVLEAAGSLWQSGALEGKPTGVFTSTGSIHGGQETTAVTTFIALMHFGMIYVGLPYGENPEQLTTEGIGGSPYAASTVAGPKDERQTTEPEFTMAGRLGARVAKVAEALRGLNS
ncbi:flavoprotein [Paenibacillus swuensis]|uniref:Flavoprotein n=1 Tax=Paenibacillus swuensis TaxID=1178515 RepID=A0A172TEI4_9BACL|nr:NAD(P)H:quinone oxidoreductase [Paenibacillus swuensis]ANE45459.1 flavoprotein [Paenibacillus swuensis]